MNINATLINLYNVCKRECWLHANGINMEHTSDLVTDGNIIQETSYAQRAMKSKEVMLTSVFNKINIAGKVDYYDAKDKIIHETKRGNKVENAHQMQVKFYIWLFELNNVFDVMGIIEYPVLRKKSEVYLLEKDRKYLKETLMDIDVLVKKRECPSKLFSKICKSCSYHDFCYSDEETN